MDNGFEPVNQKTNLQIAAFIFMIVSMVGMCALVLPLAWMIPMIVIYYQKINRGEEVSLTFVILLTIFVSTNAGILLLVDKELQKR